MKNKKQVNKKEKRVNFSIKEIIERVKYLDIYKSDLKYND
jgi:hypothetical protein